MKVEAMLWVLILVALALAIVSPTYRKYGLVVVGLAIMAVVLLIVLTDSNKPLTPVSAGPAAQQSKRVDFEQLHVDKLDIKDPQARNRIALSEVRFDQITPSEGSESGTFESIRARLYNDSTRFALTDYGYYLVVQDCIATVCTTIYDQRGLESASVPASQARDVKIAIRAGNNPGTPPFKLLGTLKITVSPTNTRAYEAAATL